MIFKKSLIGFLKPREEQDGNSLKGIVFNCQAPIYGHICRRTLYSSTGVRLVMLDSCSDRRNELSVTHDMGRVLLIGLKKAKYRTHSDGLLKPRVGPAGDKTPSRTS